MNERDHSMPAGPIEQATNTPQFLQVESSEPTNAKLKGRLPIPRVVAVLAFTAALGVFAGACNEEDNASTTVPTATSAAINSPTRESQLVTPIRTPTETPTPNPTADVTKTPSAASTTPESPAATPTREWHDFYPGIPGRDFKVEDKLHKNPNPERTFYIDELLVTFQLGLPEERIAEIVAEINGAVWAYSGGPNTFTLGVNPEEREVILAQLSSNTTEIVKASRSDISEGTNGE